MLRKIFIFFCVFNLYSFDIDKKIENILKLPPQKRYIAINNLKKEILKLKEKEREKLIKKLLSHYHVNDVPAESIIKDNK